MCKKKNILIVLAAVLIFTGCKERVKSKNGTLSWFDMSQVHKEGNSAAKASQNDDNHTKKISHSPIDPPNAYRTESEPSNWYIRLVAEDPKRGLRTVNSQLGEVDADDMDRHTLKALTPYGQSYLDIVFRDPEGVEKGDYKSSFHSYAQDIRKVWRFVVLSSDANATIQLGWRGIYVLDPYRDAEDRQRYREYRSLHNPLMYRMKLVDTETGEEVTAVVNGRPQSYEFSMNGSHERIFEWVVEPDSVIVKKVKRRSTTVNIEDRNKQVFQPHSKLYKKKQVFDLSHPPERDNK